ncbi:MAG: branched-chain amino acid ABC transporter permease [Chloroflexi bacterium]|nr:branched-chain amino acid ABC transporter permease [Chloroflexota bacterium]
MLPLLIHPVLALDILVWGLFAVALDLLLGYGGLLSFGQAMFWGTAGYTAGLVAKYLEAPVPLALLAGVAACVVMALPIGYLAVRRTGASFAIVTLAFAQMISFIVDEWRDVTGGENGLQGIPRTLVDLSLSDSLTFYYAALPFALFGYWLAYRIVHSSFGHVFTAIRDDETHARALGYPIRRYRLLGFVLSAGLAGLAGGLNALSHGFVTLDSVHWTTSGTVVVMTVLGGIGTLWGSVVGAAVVLLLRDVLSTWTDAWGLVSGAIVVVVVLGFRRGIWGTFAHLRRERRADAASRRSPAGGTVRGRTPS